MDFIKLDAVFEYMDKSNVTGLSKKKQERGSGFSKRTINKYKYELHTMFNNLQEMFGITKPEEVKPKMVMEYHKKCINEYKSGNKSISYHLHTLDDAIHAFQSYAVESGQYQYHLKMPRKEKLEKQLKEEKVYRKAKDTKVKANNRDEIKKVCDYLRNEVGTDAANVAADALWGEFVSGRRISAQLRQTAGDFNANKGTLTSYGDKGGKDNYGVLKPEAVQHYAKLAEGKKAGAPMLNIKYTKGERAGEDKKIEQMRVQVSDLIRNASNKLYKRGETKNRVSSHGARKGFAQEQALMYLQKSKTELKKMLDNLVKNDPKLQGKINNVMKNILDKFKIEKNKAIREQKGFRKKELVVLLTSIDINHSRMDVMRYYLDKDFWKSVDKKLLYK